ncbi:muramidase family protein [Flavobacterium sp. UBA6135]|uniref:muramidase family protein n=1 Tax=Flavobacterium sp. UBA6135 TaxID=1946553 RepID=UPI0025B90570|nr:LysM peptidoglycan-binding domain-containing protein [Flavobacterium sp. UBA6135]
MKQFLFFLVLSVQVSFSQATPENGALSSILHVVTSGETILKIATDYSVDPSEIYRENRYAIDGISAGMELKFLGYKKMKTPKNSIVISEPIAIAGPFETKTPVSPEKEVKIITTSVPEIRSAAIYHKVKTGETLYGLSKKYEVTIAALQQNNSELLKKGLQIGQIITIPSNGTVIEKSFEVPKNALIKHTVQPKETLYGLSKRYGVTVDEIQSLNEKTLRNGLQIGQVILIQTH